MQKAVLPIAEQVVGELGDLGELNDVVWLSVLIFVSILGRRKGRPPRQAHPWCHRGLDGLDQTGVPERRLGLPLPLIAHILRLNVCVLSADV